MPDEIPFRIAGQRVQATIYLNFENWSPYNMADPYWVLQNGALVAHDAEIGEEVEIGFGVIIEASASVGDRVSIGYLSRIGDATKVGANTKIGTNCIVESECNIGERCVIETNCYIGSMNDIPAGTELGGHTYIMHETLDSSRPAKFDAADGFVVITHSRMKTHIIPGVFDDELDASAGVEQP